MPVPANPVNAVETIARVVLVGPGQVWLRGRDGGIFRAWAPADVTDDLTEDVDVHVYLSAEGGVNGWWDRRSGIAVNQRRLTAGERPDRGVDLACRGTCGLVWEAPAGDRLLAAREHCLTCAGRLSAD